jgi:hypothetical protein
MDTLAVTPAQEAMEREVNAVCVDVADLGTVKTPWGNKPQVNLIFESDVTDQYGEQRILIRTFNNYAHEQSALSVAVRSWCGRDLASEEEAGTLDLATLVGLQVRLKLQPTLTRSGHLFDKIVEFLPPGDVHVQQSKYRPEED